MFWRSKTSGPKTPLLTNVKTNPPSPINSKTDDTMDTNSKNKLTNCCNAFCNIIKSQLLVILTMVGVIIGLAIGFGIRPLQPSKSVLMWIGLPGEMFLNLVELTIAPLIVSSVIAATGSLAPKQNGKVGIVYITYGAIMNLIGAATGLILGTTIIPGRNVLHSNNTRIDMVDTDTERQMQDVLADLLRNLAPDNIVRAAFQTAVTTYEESPTGPHLRKSIAYIDSTNILGIIVISIVFGVAVGHVKEKGKPFLNFFQSAFDITLIVIEWILWLSPIGVCSLIATSIASVEYLSGTFIQLGLFVLTVLVGVVLYQFVIMPFTHVILIGTNPFALYPKASEVLAISFATGTTSGAIPYNFKIADSMNIDRRVSSFCIPMGTAMINTGSAVFQATSIVFLSQMNNNWLDASEIVVLLVLTTICCLTLPAVPSSSIFIIIMLCNTLGLPAESVGILFAVEWLLDRLRVTVNAMNEVHAYIFTWHVVKDMFESSGGKDSVKKKDSYEAITDKKPEDGEQFVKDG